MKTLPHLLVFLLLTILISCSSEDDSPETVMPIEINAAPTAVVLSLDGQDCNSILISWSASSDANEDDSITYRVYLNEDVVASDITALQFTTTVNLNSYPIALSVTAIDNNQAESQISNILEVASPVTNNIAFVDENMKQALLENGTLIDVNLDGEISECEASSFNGTLSLSLKEISNLDDLLYFTNATVLDARGNELTDASVLSNLSFEEIYLGFNQFEVFNMEANSKLKVLWVGNNDITSIDLSQFGNLENVYLSENALTSIDVTNNPFLTRLSLATNSISQIDVSSNLELKELGLSGNDLITIDLTNNLNLERLDVSANLLTSLFIEENIELREVYCANTFIEQLDFSNQSSLELLIAQNNSQLSQLNLKNGNNISLFLMAVDQSPNLNCIQVDDVDSIPNGWQKDASASYSEDCN